MNTTLETKTNRADVRGKYLTFFLAEEEYGLEILKVREIIGLLPITRVPRTPDSVVGVVNLRGKVIPVVDLRSRFGLPTVEASERSCIIVVQANGMELGAVVDHVSEVVDVAAEDIEEAPNFGAAVGTDFLLGIAKSGERVRLLLDIDRVLSSDELASEIITGDLVAPA